jgi:hypothetical protein
MDPLAKAGVVVEKSLKKLLDVALVGLDVDGTSLSEKQWRGAERKRRLCMYT